VFLILILSKSISRVLYWIIIYLGNTFLYCSSHLPGTSGPRYRSSCGVAPNGVYIDRQVAMPLVSSYLTFPPLRKDIAAFPRYISVALSLKSPSPGVTRHPALWSPDFPHVRPFGTLHAIIWLTQLNFIVYCLNSAFTC